MSAMPWRQRVFGPCGTSPQGTNPAPQYSGRNIRPAYCLRYDWTGWPTDGTCLPPQTAEIARSAANHWDSDGLHLLEPHATAEKVQLLFSATPQVSPVFFCQRAKGRLQHALRETGAPVDFSRKVSFRIDVIRRIVRQS